MRFLSLFFLLILFTVQCIWSQNLDDLYRLKEYNSRRVSSWDTSGGNWDRIQIPSDTTVTLAFIKGAGIIKHIWVTIAHTDKMSKRNVLIRMFWDGEQNPSVESPIGDFFGQGWGEDYIMNSLPLVCAPARGKAMNCYFPMPFSESAKITIENQSENKIAAFYFYIEYEEHETISLETPRFHAWWNRELTEPLPEGENEWATLGGNTCSSQNCRW